jgi:LPXTG-site transpeptidase (sortase) family protein
MFIDIFKITPGKRSIKYRTRKGVLFSNPGKFRKLIFYFGNWLIIGSSLYGIYLYYPLGMAVINYWSYDVPTVVLNDAPLAYPSPAILPETPKEYSLSIPKIKAYAKIIEDVSPFNQKEYREVLKNNAVAQAKDTSEIDQGLGKSTYIFAHSTQQGLSAVRNNSVFYLLAELKNNDDVFVNKNGKIYSYKVYMQKIISAYQTEYLKYTEPDKEILILQTCWPIGTDWKRLLVFAQRIK